MGIYIKGMEMSKSCVECRFGSIESCNETEPLIIRCIVLDNFTHEVDWHEVCPLVEVSPHGRLIDADELKQKMHYDAFDWLVLNESDVDDAPTIIKSEG